MKAKAVRIERVELVIGNKKIELSLEEAKELSDVLADLFGKHPAVIPYPYPVYPYIWYEGKPLVTTGSTWMVSCADTNGTLSMSNAVQ